MKQQLHFVTLGVKDLSRMKMFYENTFGWTTIKDSDGIVFFKLNGFILSLYPADELAEDIGMKKWTGGINVTLSISFESEKEVDKVYDELISKGAKPVRQPEKVFWGGHRGYLADIEDNFWELAYNPFLTLDRSGNVTSHF